jgi:hypothetical protein
MARRPGGWPRAAVVLVSAWPFEGDARYSNYRRFDTSVRLVPDHARAAGAGR